MSSFSAGTMQPRIRPVPHVSPAVFPQSFSRQVPPRSTPGTSVFKVTARSPAPRVQVPTAWSAPEGSGTDPRMMSPGATARVHSLASPTGSSRSIAVSQQAAKSPGRQTRLVPVKSCAVAPLPRRLQGCDAVVVNQLRPPELTPSAVSPPEELASVLHENGFQEVRQAGDGNCQFRSLAYAVGLDPETGHRILRENVVRELIDQRELYSEYVEGSYDDYIERMLYDGQWGDHVTLQAFVNSTARQLIIFTDHPTNPVQVVEPMVETSDLDALVLVFYGEVHYNAAERRW